MSGRGPRWLCALGVATTMLVTPDGWASTSEACNTDAIRAQAEQTFPEYDVHAVRATDGVVTMVLARHGGPPIFAIGLRAAGSAFFTSVMAREINVAEGAERARVGQLVADWYRLSAVQDALAQCGGAVSLSAADSDDAVRSAATAALGDLRLGDVEEARIEVGALLLSLALVLAPLALRRRASPMRPPTEWADLAALLVFALIASTLAVAVAWRLAPETDEVVTLGARHQALSSLLAWSVGGEPFNPPATSVMFALWLRVAGGFFAARMLSIAIIPLTAWVAYRAGTVMSGRSVGLSFAGLVILAPAYVRLAAIARGYALIVFTLCALLAAVAGTERRGSRGAAVGVAGLLGVWVSFLLWPLALAAPWLARLERRDRLRITAALVLAGAALAPRIVNGLTTSAGKADVFELRSSLDVLGYALATVAQAPPGESSGSAGLLWVARGLALVLIAAAIVQLRSGQPRQFRNAALAFALVSIPILALLSGGRGIRERHVIGLQVVLAALAAIGLGRMLSAAQGSPRWAFGCLLAAALATLCALGNLALVRQARGWIELAGLCRGADLLVIVPRSAEMSAHAMLTGDSPLGSRGVRWPPVCESDTEWWCRRVGSLQVLSVDYVTEGVVSAAAAFSRSVWIFAGDDRNLPPSLRACPHVMQEAPWLVLDCASTMLRRE